MDDDPFRQPWEDEGPRASSGRPAGGGDALLVPLARALVAQPSSHRSGHPGRSRAMLRQEVTRLFRSDALVGFCQSGPDRRASAHAGKLSSARGHAPTLRLGPTSHTEIRMGADVTSDRDAHGGIVNLISRRRRPVFFRP
jgi:hypothetical protein